MRDRASKSWMTTYAGQAVHAAEPVPAVGAYRETQKEREKHVERKKDAGRRPSETHGNRESERSNAHISRSRRRR